jgi:hypothetical protein
MKRFISLLICAVMVTLALSACKNEDSAAAEMTERVTNVYRTDYVDLPDGLKATGTIHATDDRLYIACVKTTTAADEYGEVVYSHESFLHSIDFDGQNPMTEEMPDFVEWGLKAFCVNPDGSRLFYGQLYTENERALKMVLMKIDSDGNTVYSISPELMIPTSHTGIQYYSAYGPRMACDSEGNAYLLSDDIPDTLLAVSPNGEKLFDFTVNATHLLSISHVPSENRMLVSYYDTAKRTAVFKYVDMGTENWATPSPPRTRRSKFTSTMTTTTECTSKAHTLFRDTAKAILKRLN